MRKELIKGQKYCTGINKKLKDCKKFQSELNLDWYDYGARFYDPQIGRWHVIDNKAEKYSFSSPYAYTLNNPIKFIDPNGKEIWIAWSYESNGKRRTESYQYKNGNLYDKKGNEYKGDNSYLNEVKSHLDLLKEDNLYSKEIVGTLESSDKIHTITNFDKKYGGKRGNYQIETKDSSLTYFDAFSKVDPENPEKKRDPRVGLIHELTHDFDIDQNNVCIK